MYARAHELGAVLNAGDGWYLVAGYAAASQVLRSPAFAPPAPDSRPGLGERRALALMNRSILEAGPDAHGRMRPAIAAAFTPRRVAALEPAVTAAAETLLSRLEAAAGGGEPVDFMEEFACQLPVTVICELLGVPSADRGRFRGAGRRPDRRPGTPARRGPPGYRRQAAAELGEYLTQMIAARRAAPRDDLVSALAAAGDGVRLPDDELLANLILLLVAGFETTTGLLGNGTALLLDHPDTAAALRSGTVPVEGFTDEVLRYESPVQLTTRQALAAGQVIDGTPVPPGARLIVLIGAANRDPARYPRPDRLRPRPHRQQTAQLRRRAPRLPRQRPGPPRSRHRLPPAPRSFPAPRPRSRCRPHPPRPAHPARVPHPPGHHWRVRGSRAPAQLGMSGAAIIVTVGAWNIPAAWRGP